MISNKSQARDK